MTNITVVVIGDNEAARIAAARAHEVNPEVRLVTIKSESDYLSLDMDARAVLICDGDETQRIRFDSLIFASERRDLRLAPQKSGRILPEFSFEVAQQVSRAQGSSRIDKREDAASLDVQLLADAGAMLGKDGTFFVDEHMTTSLDGIYACGNVVSLVKSIGPGRHAHLSRSLIARCAQVAGANAASAKPIDKVSPCAGAEILEVNGLFFGRTGISNTELHQVFKQGEYVRATVFEGNIMVRLLARRDSGSIISAELVGDSGLINQLNLLSLAVVKRLRVEDLFDLDISSTLREAAERLRSELREDTTSIFGEKLALWLAEGRPFTCLDVGDEPSNISKYMKATHLPLKDLSTKASHFSSANPIILSSQNGRSALVAYRVLKNTLGQNSLFHLEGGTRAFELLLDTDATRKRPLS